MTDYKFYVIVSNIENVKRSNIDHRKEMNHENDSYRNRKSL